MNVGELGNFVSYAFAPASVVAPLGTVNNSGLHWMITLMMLCSSSPSLLIVFLRLLCWGSISTRYHFY